jgi:hypothetical protein
MDHVVYLDKKAQELEKVLSGAKTMIIRGAAGRKIPYGRVSQGDMLYMLENDGSGLIKAKAKVKTVLNSEKMTPEESADLIAEYHEALQLTAAQLKRWSGKRYLVLIEIAKVDEVEPFKIDKSAFGNMDDWLPVGDIGEVRSI